MVLFEVSIALYRCTRASMSYRWCVSRRQHIWQLRWVFVLILTRLKKPPFRTLLLTKGQPSMHSYLAKTSSSPFQLINLIKRNIPSNMLPFTLSLKTRGKKAVRQTDRQMVRANSSSHPLLCCLVSFLGSLPLQVYLIILALSVPASHAGPP